MTSDGGSQPEPPPQPPPYGPPPQPPHGQTPPYGLPPPHGWGRGRRCGSEDQQRHDGETRPNDRGGWWSRGHRWDRPGHGPQPTGPDSGKPHGAWDGPQGPGNGPHGRWKNPRWSRPDDGQYGPEPWSSEWKIDPENEINNNRPWSRHYRPSYPQGLQDPHFWDGPQGSHNESQSPQNQATSGGSGGWAHHCGPLWRNSPAPSGQNGPNGLNGPNGAGGRNCGEAPSGSAPSCGPSWLGAALTGVGLLGVYSIFKRS